MDSKAVLYSAGNNDEMPTPREAVTPLLKYLELATPDLWMRSKDREDRMNSTMEDLRKAPADRKIWNTPDFPEEGWLPTIWCPMDEIHSQFVQVFKEAGYPVVYSHIDAGQDFYSYEPKKWDVMISNPPFSGKRHIFNRALSFGRPFALIMSLTWLNDSAIKQIFSDKDLQLLMFDKRIQYNDKKKITFSSAYYAWNFFPKQIIMEKLPGKSL